jgi:hypothetical protein
LHLSATAFNMDDKKAEQLQHIASIKYMSHTTYEGSSFEEQQIGGLEKNPIMTNLREQLRLDIKIIKGAISLLMNLNSRADI